jgi:hypothetical protein
MRLTGLGAVVVSGEDAEAVLIAVRVSIDHLGILLVIGGGGGRLRAAESLAARWQDAERLVATGRGEG